ncbi:MAG: ribonuclease III [Clostridia bacterium]|nr:MAG: ribonuclease III [Clostridia bacterium]
MQKDLASLMEALGYTFQDMSLLENALTHSSYANESDRHLASNERLEFLGDSVLGFITANELFQKETGPEGELTKLRAAVVCEKALHSYSLQLHVGDYLRLGKGELHTGGNERPSILADAFEAIVAAVYLDGGLEPAKKLVLRFVVPEVGNQRRRHFKDYKTTLQEIIQQNPGEMLEYVLTGESGPDHNKQFTVQVFLNSNIIGTGRGRSKKDAEQQAAKEALALMGYR